MIGGRNMLGAGVDPRLFSYDFSGAYRIGENYAKAISGLGQSIAQGIEGYKATKKENAALTGQIKGYEQQIDSMINLFPESTDSLSQIKVSINDPNKSLVERAAEAKATGESIQNILTIMKARGAINMQDARLNKLTSGGGGSSGRASSGGGASSGSGGGGGAAPQNAGGGWSSGGFTVN